MLSDLTALINILLPTINSEKKKTMKQNKRVYRKGSIPLVQKATEREKEKSRKFHCFRCQTIYQLIEVHSQESSNCSDNCQKKWQTILHEYYQEKVLGYIRQQEEEFKEND